VNGNVRTVRSFCRVCTSVCGILVDVEGDEIVRVRGDHDHPLSHGYTCAKGRALPQLPVEVTPVARRREISEAGRARGRR
jgi:anaerobic selenocysteine-containing dehydrogenase